MWKSLGPSGPQVGMGILGKLYELVAVGPGGSDERIASIFRTLPVRPPASYVCPSFIATKRTAYRYILWKKIG